MSQAERTALERLIALAISNARDGQVVATFLLAWSNADTFGGFNLADLWRVQTAVANDMLTVSTLIARARAFPDTLGYASDFQLIRLQNAT